MPTDEQPPPPQEQPYPGRTEPMRPHPEDEMRGYVGRNLLEGRRALITGGDSGIGRAVSVAFAKEGADVGIVYLSEHDDAAHTAGLVEAEGRRCVTAAADLAEEARCSEVVNSIVGQLGGLEILVNHVGTQKPVESFQDITTEQLDRTFRVNVYSYFWVTKAALAHLPDGSAIINTGSVNGLRGNKSLLDYAASKGAVHVLTYSLAKSLEERRIRVNCVAPGPVWTPLIPATVDKEHVAGFGGHVPLGRPAQPDEIAPSYVFFASERLSSYYTGQLLTPIGGETHPG